MKFIRNSLIAICASFLISGFATLQAYQLEVHNQSEEPVIVWELANNQQSFMRKAIMPYEQRRTFAPFIYTSKGEYKVSPASSSSELTRTVLITSSGHRSLSDKRVQNIQIQPETVAVVIIVNPDGTVSLTSR